MKRTKIRRKKTKFINLEEEYEKAWLRRLSPGEADNLLKKHKGNVWKAEKEWWVSRGFRGPEIKKKKIRAEEQEWHRDWLRLYFPKEKDRLLKKHAGNAKQAWYEAVLKRYFPEEAKKLFKK